MPVDPETGLSILPPANQGPLGGALQIGNDVQAMEMAKRNQAEKMLQQHMMELQFQQKQHEYNQQLGYESSMRDADPDASTSQLIRQSAQFMPAGQGVNALSNTEYHEGMVADRAMLGQAALQKGNAAQITAGAKADRVPAQNAKDYATSDYETSRSAYFDQLNETRRRGQDIALQIAGIRASGKTGHLDRDISSLSNMVAMQRHRILRDTQSFNELKNIGATQEDMAAARAHLAGEISDLNDMQDRLNDLKSGKTVKQPTDQGTGDPNKPIQTPGGTKGGGFGSLGLPLQPKAPAAPSTP